VSQFDRLRLCRRIMGVLAKRAAIKKRGGTTARKSAAKSATAKRSRTSKHDRWDTVTDTLANGGANLILPKKRAT
jgi:hypothetical protein